MIDEKELLKLIRDDICDGYDDESIYERIRLKFKANRQWTWTYRDVNYNKQEQTNSDSNYNEAKQLVLMIREEIKRAESALKQRKCSATKCNLRFLSPHHSIDVITYPKGVFSFYSIDYLTGQKNRLRFKENLKIFPDVLSIYVLGFKQFLVIKSAGSDYDNSDSETFRTQIVYLIGLDNVECKLLGSKEYPHDIKSVVKDELCCDKFCLFSDQLDHVQICKLEGSKIKFETTTINMDFDQIGSMVKPLHKSFQLKGNEMRGLVLARNIDNGYLIAIIDVKLNGSQSLFKKRFELDISVDEYSSFIQTQSCNFAWNDQKLIVLLRPYFNVACSFMAIDTETEKLTRFQPKLQIDYGFCNVTDMIVDDGILLICATTNQTRLHFNHRIPLSRPDKLKNLASDKFNKQLMFMEEDQRDYLTNRCCVLK